MDVNGFFNVFQGTYNSGAPPCTIWEGLESVLPTFSGGYWWFTMASSVDLVTIDVWLRYLVCSKSWPCWSGTSWPKKVVAKCCQTLLCRSRKTWWKTITEWSDIRAVLASNLQIHQNSQPRGQFEDNLAEFDRVCTILHNLLRLWARERHASHQRSNKLTCRVIFIAAPKWNRVS